MEIHKTFKYIPHRPTQSLIHTQQGHPGCLMHGTEAFPGAIMLTKRGFPAGIKHAKTVF